jgi:hypothetical protein
MGTPDAREGIMRRLTLPLLLVVSLAAGPGRGQDVSGGGYLDLRLSNSGAERAAVDGGLGKTRFGDDGTAIHLAEVALYGNVQITEDLLGFADLRYEPSQRTAVDLIESYLRYRPVSLTPWRWSVKAGAFFPPISEENTAPGWTSPWTLTPSAINSWVGEELRTIGAEGKVEWRGESDRIEAEVAVFGWNDAAGVALADRGWAMTDRVTGLFDRLRLPNALSSPSNPGAVWRDPFSEIDGNPGWYAGLSWRHEDWGKLDLLYYDNEADAHAFDHEYAWHTRFVGAGTQTGIGPVTILAQAISGTTTIDPTGDDAFNTDFQAAYGLLGYRIGDWRLAARADLFATEAQSHDAGSRLSEHGTAQTIALSWVPIEYAKLTLEGLRVDVWRTQRLASGLSPGQVDHQLQLGAKFMF